MWCLSMAERRVIILDKHDLIAGAQILSWIAFPNRPEHGVNLLNQWFWARRKHRGEPVPTLPFKLKKPNRIEAQLKVFERQLRRGFVAAEWFSHKSASGPSAPPMIKGFGISTRKLSSRWGWYLADQNDPDDFKEPSNVIRSVWSPRKNILHLARSFSFVIMEKMNEQGIERFDLERTVFDPVWVEKTISDSEGQARMAELLGAFEINNFYKFERDSF
jgi:hypothetical protein